MSIDRTSQTSVAQQQRLSSLPSKPDADGAAPAVGATATPVDPKADTKTNVAQSIVDSARSLAKSAEDAIRQQFQGGSADRLPAANLELVGLQGHCGRGGRCQGTGRPPPPRPRRGFTA